jgi:hypothetical protein
MFALVMEDLVLPILEGRNTFLKGAQTEEMVAEEVI